MTTSAASARTDYEARSYVESVRWPRGSACFHCGDFNVVRLECESTNPSVLKRQDRPKSSPVSVGSVFHGLHIPLHMWSMAFYLACSVKNDISALQLQRMLGFGSYKPAWHMAHRIRHAMRCDPLRGMLSGSVEADDTWIGGEPRVHAPKKSMSERETPMAALVERDGRARAFPVKHVNSWTLRKALRENVDTSKSRLMTDESSAYNSAGREFKGGHETTNHSLGEYLRPGGIHSNSAESFFALLKRGVHGTFHHVSRRHLARYCDEFSFRWTFRKATDGERTIAALRASDGKRLAYRAV